MLFSKVAWVPLADFGNVVAVWPKILHDFKTHPVNGEYVHTETEASTGSISIPL